MRQPVKIISIEHLTHDVLRIVAEKPEGLVFTPGQAADISINKPGWEEEKRAFTFTSLPGEDHIEFSIKTYPSRHGVTEQLLALKAGDELIVHDVFGDIHYKGEGIFLAGGAGVTPFIAIFKELQRKNAIGHNKLIFANKTQMDIILEDQFRKWLGDRFINVLSEEMIQGYIPGHITAELIRQHLTTVTKYFYLCGPPPMMEAVEKQLASLGIRDDAIIKEAF
jgi:ferredoxin-NADP reductase